MPSTIYVHRYNIIYRTTNLLNNKIYIGKHSTDNLNDGYMGSGKYLIRVIKKYGQDNFKCDIISHHDSSEAAFIEEKRLVDSDFISQPNVYNIILGGYGNNKGYITEEQKMLISKTLKSRYASGELSVVQTPESLARGIATRKANILSGKTTQSTGWKNPCSDAKKLSISKANTGKKRTTKQKECLRQINLGKILPQKHKDKMSKAVLNKSKIKCPHCVVKARGSVMYRFHFKNCKHNPNQSERDTVTCPHCNKTDPNIVRMKNQHFDYCEHNQKKSKERRLVVHTVIR